MKILRIEILILPILFLAVILRPMPEASLKNSVIVNAKIVALAASSEAEDISFRLADDNSLYYIDNGLEKGIDLQDFKSSLLKQEVEVFYIKHHTPLDPKQKNRQVSRIKLGDRIIYDEIVRH